MEPLAIIIGVIGAIVAAISLVIGVAQLIIVIKSRGKHDETPEFVHLLEEYKQNLQKSPEPNIADKPKTGEIIDQVERLEFELKALLPTAPADQLESAEQQKQRAAVEHKLAKAARYFVEGLKNYKRADYQKARKNFEASLSEHSTASVLNNLGVVYYNLRSFDSALKAYDDAERLREKRKLPPDPDLYKNRGNVCSALSSFKDALKAYDEAERLRKDQGLPPDPIISFGRAISYRDLGNFKFAGKHAIDAILAYSELGVTTPSFLVKLMGGLFRQVTDPDYVGDKPSPPAPPQRTLAETRKPGHDAFICHRRDNAGDKAQLIKTLLENKGLTIFVDVAGLRYGDYRHNLLTNIEDSKALVILLTPGATVNCKAEDDMLRQELLHARNSGRRVIPVECEGFRWMDEPKLPDCLAWLPDLNYIPYSHDFLDAFIDKLADWIRG